MDPLQIGTAAGKWLWDIAGKDAAKGLGAVAKKSWQRFKWSDKEQTYRDKLIKLYSSTTVLGNPKEIHLSRIYTDVYILDHLSKLKRADIRDDKDVLSLMEDVFGRRKDSNRSKLLDTVRRKGRVFVLGKPGAGKSTFLRSLVMSCCAGKLDATPIFVPIRHWNDTGLALLDYVASEFDVCGFPDAKLFIEHLLRTDKVIVLFDGLDEAPGRDNARTKITQAIVDFSRKYSAPRIVITCRTAASDYSFLGFSYVEIADFTHQQQNSFIDNWYRDTAISAKTVTDELSTRKNEGLRELARTPLLLTLLCLVYDETLSFPKRRVELYQEATNALLKKWDSTRGIQRSDMYGCITHVRREQLLCRLAIETFSQGTILIGSGAAQLILRDYLRTLPEAAEVELIDPEVILQTMESQHGLFVERAAGIYSFSHLTLHEYFTAKYLADHASTDRLNDIVKQHLIDDRWREVFLLLSSLLDDATPLFEAIEKLFNESFLSNIPLHDFLESFSGSAFVPFYSVESMKAPADEMQCPAVSITKLPKITKAMDLALLLATQFKYFRGADDALWRVRRLIAYLRVTADISTSDSLPDHPRLLGLLTNYLAASNVALECVQLAALADRTQVVNRLIMPRAFGR